MNRKRTRRWLHAQICFAGCVLLFSLKKRASRVLPIKELAYVVTLDHEGPAIAENRGRLRRFLERTESMCNGTFMDIQFILGSVHERRGYGITNAFLEALRHAARNNVQRAYIFEDDAYFMNPFLCRHVFRDELWDSAPANRFAIFLAAHEVERIGSNVVTPLFTFTPLKFHAGAYAWAIEREHFVPLINLWQRRVKSHSSSLAPDEDLSVQASLMKPNSKSYLIRYPQLIRHAGGQKGYSNTWSKMREEVPDYEKFVIVTSVTSCTEQPKIDSIFSHYLMLFKFIQEVIVVCDTFANETIMYQQEVLSVQQNSGEVKRHISVCPGTRQQAIWTKASNPSSSLVLIVNEYVQLSHLQLVGFRDAIVSFPYAFIGLYSSRCAWAMCDDTQDKIVSSHAMVLTSKLIHSYISHRNLSDLDENHVECIPAIILTLARTNHYFQGVVSIEGDLPRSDKFVDCSDDVAHTLMA